MGFSRTRQTSWTVASVWALSLSVTAVTFAQTASETARNSGAAEAVPLELFQAPRPKKIDRPKFPGDQKVLEQEGWVELAFMVDPAGKPFEVTVIRSTGNTRFEEVAKKAVERSTFEPGSLNGKPIESGFEMKYQFLIDTHPGTNREFAKAYESLGAAIKAGDRAAADAAMSRLKVTTLFEDAYVGLATYKYALKWGDESQQLAGLRRAIAEEDVARYLPEAAFRSTLLACIALEVKMRLYAEAMTTWTRLQRMGLDQDTEAQIKSVIAKLERLRSDDTSYEIAGLMENGSSYLHLFKRHFRIAVSQGLVSQVKLRCEQRYVYFAFDPTLQYEVASKDGQCSIELEGAPGTRFKLVQF